MVIFKVKPVKNKANGQLNFSIPKKKLTLKAKKMLNSPQMPYFKFRLESFD